MYISERYVCQNSAALGTVSTTLGTHHLVYTISENTYLLGVSFDCNITCVLQKRKIDMVGFLFENLAMQLKSSQLLSINVICIFRQTRLTYRKTAIFFLLFF